MNVFRSRKKSIAEADGERPSFDKPPPVPSVPTPQSSRGRAIFRRKPQPEPKKEMDIAAALPSTDDFRTSLLLPNLSARFSMLREQDDPNTKIGKANDDSVLFPKRSSRMDLFGHGLSDIAEVSSINGSIRPPFAYDRDGYSSADGYGTDEDSSTLNGNIMDRRKPGAGNKFFGGRQKVYKIPQDGHGSTRDLNAGAQDRPAGRPVYEEDISMSLFQALRAKEKERKFSEDNSYFDDREERSSREQERDAKRATSSSTNSNPREGRISTAATSIASQFGAKASPVTTPGQERVGQKKRLYGQGLDQQIHDQQSSAVNRLNSISRGPGFPRSGSTGPTLSRSASNLNDKFRSSSPFSPVLRSGSPSPVAGFGGFDFGVNGSRSNSRGPEVVKQTPPMSPSGSSPVDPTLVAALEPNDLGKATASGAFNKPKTSFNEQQFAQRQLQLQEGRNTPPLRSLSRTESGSDVSNRLRNGSLASVRSGNSNRPPHIDTSRATSTASNHRHVVISPGSSQNLNGAYFADSSGSDYDSEPNSPEITRQSFDGFVSRKTSEDTRFDSRKNSEDNRPALQEIREEHHGHPALIRSPTDQADFMDPTNGTPISSPTVVSRTEYPTNALNEIIPDTITNSEVSSGLGAGLNDLIRGHLRSDSGASSIYPASPGLPPDGFGQTSPPADAQMPIVHQNMSANAKQLLERASQLANGPSKVHDVLGGVREDKVQQILGGEAPRRSNDSNRTAWQEQLKMGGHTRGASTETQKEREDFANELAERRRAVQDNLMRSMEENSRSSSPAKNPEMSPAKNGGFSLLKKTPRASTEEHPPKAMKMLGMSAVSSNRASPENGERSSGRMRAPSQTSDGRPKVPAGNGPSFRDRSIGAERRERFFRKTSAPPQTQMFEQQPNASLPLPPSNHGFRSKSSPAEQPMSFHPAGRARKYSPPNTKTPLGPAPVSAQPSAGRRWPSQDRPNHMGRPGQQPASYFPPNTPDSATAAGFMTASIDSPRPSPMSPNYSTNSTPSSEHPPNIAASSSNPAYLPPGSRPRNRSVSKHEISSPTFLSATSSRSTVDLPPGASLLNGMQEYHNNPGAPPLPPINPNRRRGRVEITQNVMTAFGGISPAGGISSQPQSAHPDNEERSTFSADDDEPKTSRPRARLRKTSSEGGSIAAKARHQALMREAESIPGTPRLPTQQQASSGWASRKSSESRVR